MDRALLAKIGGVVRKERAAQRLELGTLARKAAVKPERLQALEAGEPGATTLDLDRIAGALQLDPVALGLGQRKATLGALFLRHRGDYQDFAPKDAVAFEWALRQGRALARLNSDAVAFRERFAPAAVARKGKAAPAWQGYELARRVRAALGDSEGPLGDLRVLLEDRFAIAVLVVQLATPALGAASTRQQHDAAIILNAADEERARNPLVDRVHLAHELCHLLFDPVPATGVALVLDAQTSEGKLEQRAKAFAAELLVPAASLRVLIGSEPLASKTAAKAAVTTVRDRFGVPWELPVWHLKNAGCISDDVADALLSGARPAYAKPRTDLPDAGGPSKGLIAHLRDALDDGLVSRGEALSVLDAPAGASLPWER